MPRTLPGGLVVAVSPPAKKVMCRIKARPETSDFKGTALEKYPPVSKPALPHA